MYPCERCGLARDGKSQHNNSGLEHDCVSALHTWVAQLRTERNEWQTRWTETETERVTLQGQLTADRAWLEEHLARLKKLAAGHGTLGARIEDLEVEIVRLQTIVDAQAELIDWYETEHDRGTHDEESLPEDFLELEKAVEAAKAAKGL